MGRLFSRRIVMQEKKDCRNGNGREHVVCVERECPDDLRLPDFATGTLLRRASQKAAALSDALLRIDRDTRQAPDILFNRAGREQDKGHRDEYKEVSPVFKMNI